MRDYDSLGYAIHYNNRLENCMEYELKNPSAGFRCMSTILDTIHRDINKLVGAYGKNYDKDLLNIRIYGLHMFLEYDLIEVPESSSTAIVTKDGSEYLELLGYESAVNKLQAYVNCRQDLSQNHNYSTDEIDAMFKELFGE